MCWGHHSWEHRCVDLLAGKEQGFERNMSLVLVCVILFYAWSFFFLRGLSSGVTKRTMPQFFSSALLNIQLFAMMVRMSVVGGYFAAVQVAEN